ncbi:MAG: ParA family protein [Clostridiales bacterium]|jgi:chromosome partitioning protein|nr:ParA family protein [Clostridiales bacterium]
MSKTISVISCKGGVGKTTSAVNISSFIHTQGKRVLAVDLDYQHNLSKHFGIFPGHLKDKPTVYDLFNAAMDDDCTDSAMNEMVHNAVVKSTTVDVLPTTAKLSLLEKVLPTATCREFILKGILKHIKDEYDYIFIDCHPGCDLFALNALTVSDSVIIPVEAHPLGLEGLDQVEKLISTAQRQLNPNLKVEGILLTKFQNNTNCCRNIRDVVKDSYGNRMHIFDEHIKYSINIAEAPEFGLSIHEYAPKIEAAQSYAKIAMEVMFK